MSLKFQLFFFHGACSACPSACKRTQVLQKAKMMPWRQHIVTMQGNRVQTKG